MKKTSQLVTLLTSLFIAFSASLYAGVDKDTDENTVTLAGHDVVSYFTESKAVLGDAKYIATHNDAIYQFSSAQNRDAFNQDPSKYEPAYGGFCAYGTSVGKKFSVNGKAFKVVDGKLYVNKNLEVYDLWIKDIPGNIQKANKQWKVIKDTPAGEL